MIQSTFGLLLEIFGEGTMTILWESVISFIRDEDRNSGKPGLDPDDAHQELVAISMKLLTDKFHKVIN